MLAACSTADDPMLFCSMLPASFFFREHRHHLNRWSLCAQEICYKNALLGQFFQSGKTLPIQARGPRRGGELAGGLQAGCRAASQCCATCTQCQ